MWPFGTGLFHQGQISRGSSRLCVYQYYFPFYHWMYHSCSISNLFKSVWGCFSLGLLPIQLLWTPEYRLSEISSVQFSCSVVSDSWQRNESQHTRPPCPSPTPGVHSDSCPLSQWCHPAISSSVVPFSSCPQSLPASESFPMSWLFAWGGQSTGVSALASFLPKKSQG